MKSLLCKPADRDFILHTRQTVISTLGNTNCYIGMVPKGFRALFTIFKQDSAHYLYLSIINSVFFTSLNNFGVNAPSKIFSIWLMILIFVKSDNINIAHNDDKENKILKKEDEIHLQETF